VTSRFSKWISICLLVMVTGSSAATDRHVPADYPTIASAFEASNRGDVVILAPGTYTETHLQIPHGVSLHGATGFPEDVVCDGQGDGPIIESINGRDRLGVRGITFRNCHGVNGGAISLTIRQGVDINDCLFYDNHSSGQGGAVYISQINAPDNQSVMIVNCDFERNTSGLDGGGLFASFAPLLVQECYLNENTAGRDGGALFAPSRITIIIDSEFTTNTAAADGGAFDGNGRCRIQNSIFRDNEAQWGGGAIQIAEDLYQCIFTGNRSGAAGGAIVRAESVSDCEFTDNHAGLFGGAIASLGFGYDSVFTDNSATDAGGAISSPRSLERCVFRNNEAGTGGALELTSGPSEFIDCEFDGNIATNSGGAVYGWGFVNTTVFKTCLFHANSAPLGPTGVYPGSYRLTLECCTTNSTEWVANWLVIDDEECSVANDDVSFSELKLLFR
jgi:predicted outer membrane repeat protein